jgi:HlyD family secretion protein
VRDEELETLAAEIAKAKSRREYAEMQLSRTSVLTRSDVASRQALDQAENDVAVARADVAEAEANHDSAVAGPTREQRAIADAQVKAAAAALEVLERHLEKTLLRSPADGVVTVIVAEVGENVRVGQPVVVIAESGRAWLSFNAREDLLQGITVGSTVDVARRHEPDDASGRDRAQPLDPSRHGKQARDRRPRSKCAAPAPRSARWPPRIQASATVRLDAERSLRLVQCRFRPQF